VRITGELLKAERINQNLTIKDVAQSLKLTAKVITAIENGQMDELPAKTFVRGFVRGYAEFLKLDSKVVLRQFLEEMGSTNPMPKVPPPLHSYIEAMPVPTEEIRSTRPALKQTSKNFQDNTAAAASRTMPLQQDNPRRILFMVAGAIGLIFILVISNKIITHFEDRQTQNIEAPVVVSETAAAPPTLPTPIHSENPEPAVSMENTVQAVAAEAATPAGPNMPEGGFEKSSEKPVEIMVEAKKDIELYYAKGNTRQFSSLRLSANQIHILRSKTGLYLKAADGSAFKVSVDGIDQGLAGPANKEVKLSF